MVFCADTEDVCSLALTVTAALLENYQVIFLLILIFFKLFFLFRLMKILLVIWKLELKQLLIKVKV